MGRGRAGRTAAARTATGGGAAGGIARHGVMAGAVVAGAVLAVGLFAAQGCAAARGTGSGRTAPAVSGADSTHCPVPLKNLSLLGVTAAPDSLDGACDALGPQEHTP